MMYAFETAGSGKILLRHMKTGKCIRSSLGQVQSVMCDMNDPHQHFCVNFFEDATVQLENQNTCIITGSSNGSSVSSNDCSADLNFFFALDPVSAPLPTPKVVTLGDSYSSGTGLYERGRSYDVELGGFISPWKLTSRETHDCWREENSMDLPGPNYAAEEEILSFSLACKGAEMMHFWNQLDLLKFWYPSDAANKWEGSTILFTIGGNDVRTRGGKNWPALIRDCIKLQWGCHHKENNQVANWDTVEATLYATFEQLFKHAPRAKIRVMGYPRLFQKVQKVYKIFGKIIAITNVCNGVTLISTSEADWFDNNVDMLNSKIQSQVEDAKQRYPSWDIKFVSMNTYITNGACKRLSQSREIHDKVLVTNPNCLLRPDKCVEVSDSSFHPTQRGYRKYSLAFQESL